MDMAALERRVREYAHARAGDLATAFRDRARGHAPRRTGELAQSIEVDRVEDNANGTTATVVCGAVYGVYQDYGTGIYGPEGRPIRPLKPGGVLVFDWAAAGGIVFARHVKGTEPTHFWERTLDEWPEIVASVQ